MDLSHTFFSGIAGTGMSALAQYLAFQGRHVSGSDRSLDRGEEAPKRAYFESLGMRLFPQDGSGLAGVTCLVVSTAIESEHPEVKKARELGVPVVHRSDLLLELAGERKTLAVSGTSGNSTVTGMLYHVLDAGGLEPSVITGANLLSLQAQGLLGNARAGKGEWLVMEADESDGTLVKYAPEIGIILNVEKDHKEVEELLPIFRTFRDRIKGMAVLNGLDPHCRDLARPADLLFHPAAAPDGPVEDLRLGDWDSRFTVGGTGFHLRVPGRHNVANAMAALTTGRAMGISLEACARGLGEYRGVERRHVRIGESGGVTVVDDFAHNPAKVKACLETVKSGPSGGQAPPARRRVLAVFHPHGFAPMKLMGHDLVRSLLETLDGQDRVFMPEIYYAGGTADKSISSADLVAEVNSAKPIGRFLATKDEVIAALAAEARPGDWIVSMGARDPALGRFAEKILAALRARPDSPNPA